MQWQESDDAKTCKVLLLCQNTGVRMVNLLLCVKRTGGRRGRNSSCSQRILLHPWSRSPDSHAPTRRSTVAAVGHTSHLQRVWGQRLHTRSILPAWPVDSRAAPKERSSEDGWRSCGHIAAIACRSIGEVRFPLSAVQVATLSVWKSDTVRTVRDVWEEERVDIVHGEVSGDRTLQTGRVRPRSWSAWIVWPRLLVFDWLLRHRQKSDVAAWLSGYRMGSWISRGRGSFLPFSLIHS